MIILYILSCMPFDNVDDYVHFFSFTITYVINTSVPAGVYLFPNPRQRFALRIWPGTIQVSRSR